MARQDVFNAGELAPELHSRPSLAQYGRGLRRCRNFVPLPLGALRSRPGTRFVTQTGAAVRLVPFVFSDEEACVLEFTSGNLRIFADGGLVEVGPGSPFVLATPYAGGELADLRFAQEGDTLILTHPAHAPYRLTRLGAVSWTLAALTLAPPAPVFSDSNPLIKPRLREPTPPTTGEEWRWKVTAIVVGADGAERESTAFDLTELYDGAVPSLTSGAAPTMLDIKPSTPANLTWSHDFNPRPASVSAFRVYRGRGRTFGFVGETTTCEFTDTGREPNWTQGPPEGTDHFAGGEHPAAVGFFEQRLVLAGTPQRPDTLWGSSTADYFTFDRHSPAVASDPFEYELASHKREAIRWLVEMRSLIIGTASGIWAGSDLSPGLIPDLRTQEQVGTANLAPIVTESHILYVRSKGSGVRALAYTQEGGGFRGTDLSVLASHLFRGRRVVSWAWQEDPHGLVWAVLDDGRLLSLTYRPDLDAWGWAWHDTQGSVTALACIPEGEEDRLYLAVVREVSGAPICQVEQMDPFALPLDENGKPDALECVALDAAATYRGPPATTITGLVHLEGAEVYAVANGSVQGPFTVAGGEVTLAAEASVVHVGRTFTPELETLDLPQDKGRRKVVEKVRVEVVETRGLQVGESAEDLHDWQQREVSHGWGPVPQETRVAEVDISGSWNTGGRVFLRQAQPFPVTVAAIDRKVKPGGED